MHRFPDAHPISYEFVIGCGYSKGPLIASANPYARQHDEKFHGVVYGALYEVEDLVITPKVQNFVNDLMQDGGLLAV